MQNNSPLSAFARFGSTALKTLAEPVVNYGKLLGESSYQSARYIFDPIYRKAIQGKKLTNKELEQLNKTPDTVFLSSKQAGDRGKILKTGVGSTVGTMATVGGGAAIARAPAQALITTLLSGGIGAGASKLAGEDVATGAGRAVGRVPQLMGVIGATNPIFRQFVPEAGKTVASKILERGASGVANVAQGLVVDKSTSLPTTPISVGIDLALGVLGGRGSFGKAGKQAIKEGSVEQIIEQAGGWKPGMRAEFDTALFNKDAKKVAELLPQVPEEYKSRFVKEIGDLLGQSPVASAMKIPDNIPTRVAPVGQLERGFAETVRTAPDTTEPLRVGVEESPARFYEPITNADTMAQAKQLVDTNINQAEDMVFSSKAPLDATTASVGQLLIKRHQDAGDIQGAVRVFDQLAERATASGQGVQALAMFNRLTPEGILGYAQNTVRKAQEAGKKVSMSEAQTTEFMKRAEALSRLPEGLEKLLQSAELLRDVREIVPSSTLRKISSLQTMAQLINPKTWVRNLGGNMLFATFDNIQRFFGTGVDKAVSLVTKTRSVTTPDISGQVRAGKEGLQQGLEESRRGVNLAGLATQFDLPEATRTFGGKGIAGKGEEALNILLRAPDRAFYEAAVEDSLSSSARVTAMNEGLKGPELDARTIDLLGKPTKEMIEQAHLDGLYRTFQDKNAATKFFTGIKKAMNFDKEWGIGDLIIKYPKTPANLLARALDYSPIGFFGSIKQVAQPLIGNKFNQREFVDAFARATVGTAGFTALGYLLKKNGLLTGEYEKDADVRATQRKVGTGPYRVNTSGLKRFVLSGFDPAEAKLQQGDRLVSYDWAQPLSVSLAIGANTYDKALERAEKGGNIFDVQSVISTAGIAADSIAAGSDTLFIQPMVQAIKRFFQTQSPSQAIVEALAGIPASVTPTFLSQLNQVLDNTTRETYDPSVWQEGLNYALAKIPVLSNVLPPRSDTWGDEAERFQNNSNNVWNVFFNPAFTSQYLPEPEAKMVMDLYENTGEKVQFPRIVPKKITVDGVSKQLTRDEYVAYQKAMGQKTREIFTLVSQSPEFAAMDEEGRVKYLQKILTELNSEVKEEIFGIVKGKTVQK